MCGICGVIRFDRAPVDPALFKIMRASLFHRGPDDYGQHLDGPIGIANLRLSIIDLKTGRQPIYNEDRRTVIVYNGEVYNFQELRAQLTAHRFTTQSDTEVILHAYEEWGLDCLPRLNGMFAFAIWDERRQELLLARDRIGIKPLYYVLTPHYLAFASEIKALLAAGLVTPDVNSDAVGLYLALKYVPTQTTMFKGVSRLLPGEWMRVHLDARVEKGRFWQFRLQPALGVRSAADCAQELRYLVEQAVRYQLVADVPVGAFLSGGLDSGIVVTEMARQKGRGVQAFTIDYDSAKPQQNEAHYARFTAAQAGAQHTTVTCSSQTALGLLPTLVYHLDEPISEPLLAPSYLLAQAARRQVTVVLTGEGADELFAGYERYKLGYWGSWLQALPVSVRRMGLDLAERLWGEQDVKTRILRITLDPRLIADWYVQFTSAEIKALTGREFCLPDWQAASSIRNGYGLLDYLLESDTCFRLPEYILTRADKMTMAHSLEMRPPLLDNRIVDFALQLPSGLKLHGQQEKFILRQAFEGSLSQVVQRHKVAFSAPFEGWLPSLCRMYLGDSHLVQAGLIRPQELRRLLEHDPFYRGRQTEKLWSTIALELWYRVFIDRSLHASQARHEQEE